MDILKENTECDRMDVLSIKLGDLISTRLMTLADTLRQAGTLAYVREFGVTVPQLRIIVTVNAHQPVTANELSRITRIDKGWISRSIPELVDRELLVREDDPNDRRNLLLRLTQSGTDLVRRILPFADRRSRELSAGLETAEIVQILEAIQERADQILAEDRRQAEIDRPDV